MDLSIVLLLAAAMASGLFASLRWWQEPTGGSELRTWLHGASAMLVLLALLLSLDHHAAGNAQRLAAVFLAVATGMLMFLQRQRQRRFSRPLLGLHVGFALLALWVAIDRLGT